MPTKIEWTEEDEARFWNYVNKTDDCWEWVGGTFGGRYGQFRLGAKKIKAHRFAWLLAGNEIPDGLILCHHCDNVRCVRPDHLFLGTHADNARDRDLKGRKAPCAFKPLPGEMNPSAVLTRKKVEAIRRRVYAGERRKDLATEYGVAYSTICTIVRGEIWQTGLE